MGIADTFMLSALSDHAVAGVRAANQYLTIAILILEVVGNGAAIVVAQYLGSKRYKEASKISALAVTLNLLIGVIISIIFLIFSKQMMVGLNLQDDVLYSPTPSPAPAPAATFLHAPTPALPAITPVPP